MTRRLPEGLNYAAATLQGVPGNVQSSQHNPSQHSSPPRQSQTTPSVQQQPSQRLPYQESPPKRQDQKPQSHGSGHGGKKTPQSQSSKTDRLVSAQWQQADSPSYNQPPQHAQNPGHYQTQKSHPEQQRHDQGNLPTRSTEVSQDAGADESVMQHHEIPMPFWKHDRVPKSGRCMSPLEDMEPQAALEIARVFYKGGEVTAWAGPEPLPELVSDPSKEEMQAYQEKLLETQTTNRLRVLDRVLINRGWTYREDTFWLGGASKGTPPQGAEIGRLLKST